MKQETFTIENPHLLITCAGPLKIRTQAARKISLRGTAEIEENGREYHIRADSPLDLYVPEDAEVTIKQIDGDLIVKNVSGRIHIQQTGGHITAKTIDSIQIDHAAGGVLLKNVGRATIGHLAGDLYMKNATAVTADTVNGDINIKNVTEDITINRADGDVNLVAVGGDVSIQHGDRDVNLRNIGGLIDIQHATGDIRLRDGLIGGKHTLRAEHDIVVRWPVDTDVLIDAHAPEITNRLPLEHVTEEDGRLNGRLGDGNVRLTLHSQNAILLRPLYINAWQDEEIEIDIDLSEDLGQEMELFGRRLAGLGEQIAARVSTRMSELSNQLESQFKVMRKREEAVRKASRRSSTYTPPQPPPPPAAPAAPSPPAADSKAAQMKILEMLEQGKIDVDEANTLLKALE